MRFDGRLSELLFLLRTMGAGFFEIVAGLRIFFRRFFLVTVVEWFALPGRRRRQIDRQTADGRSIPSHPLTVPPAYTMSNKLPPPPLPCGSNKSALQPSNALILLIADKNIRPTCCIAFRVVHVSVRGEVNGDWNSLGN